MPGSDGYKPSQLTKIRNTTKYDNLMNLMTKYNNFMNLMDTWLPISYSQQTNSTAPTTVKTAGITSRGCTMASVVVSILATQPKDYGLSCHPPCTTLTGKSIFTAAPPVTRNKKIAAK